MNYLDIAYKEALKAKEKNEVPVGCVIVKDNKVIAKAYNKKESNKDPLGHCELLAIKKACKKLNSWRLIDCDIYITLEPCMMCLGALIHARVRKIYYGAIDNRFGAIEGKMTLLENSFNHKIEAICLDDTKCGKILSEFFKNKRSK